MSVLAIGGERRRRIASVAIPLFVYCLLGIVVVANVRPRLTVPAIFAVTALWAFTLVPARILAWRNLVAATAVLILVIPIRRDALGSNLGFELEPYRVAATLLIAAWAVFLLVDPRLRFRRSIGDAPLLVVCGATLMSIVVNVSRIQRAGVASEATKSLLFLIGYFLLFWVIVSVAGRFADIDFLVKALLLGGAAVTFFALVEARTGFSVPSRILAAIPGTHRSFPTDPNAYPDLTRSGRLRIFGSAQHPIELGAIFAMLVPLAVYLVHSTRSRIWWVVTGLLFVGSLASLSRTPVMMLLAILVVFFRQRRAATVRLWPLAIPAFVLAHVAAPGAVRGLYASFFPSGGLLHQQQNAAVGSGRLASLGPGLDVVWNHLLFGLGYGTRIVTGPAANSFTVDDMWLSLGMELGVVGAAAWLWLFVRFLRRLGREARRDDSDRGWLLTSLTASLAAFGVGMLTFDSFAFIQVTFLFFIILALAAAALSKSRPPARKLRLRLPTGPTTRTPDGADRGVAAVV